MSYAPHGKSTPVPGTLSRLGGLTARMGANKAEDEYVKFHEANGVRPRRRDQRDGLIHKAGR